MPDYQARCELLARENDALRERIAFLEDALGMTFDAPPAFQLTPTEARVMGLLLKRNYVRKDAFMAVLYGALPDADKVPDVKIIDVLVCKLRAKLDGLGIEIETKWGDGYFISADGKRRAQEVIGQAA